MRVKMSGVEGKVIYSEGAFGTILNLTHNATDYMDGYRAALALSKGKVYMDGPLILWKQENFLHVMFRGKRKHAKKLEEYLKRVNMDGTHEAMMVALNLQEKKNG